MIDITPLGVIHTPYKELTDRVPIQGNRHPETEGQVEVFPEYADGLLDLEGFSHIYLIYYFDRSREVFLRTRPYADNREHGIFAIRSPHRPNHIGLTVVELVAVEENMLTVRGLDMLDGSPLLDIKPYNPGIDGPAEARIGWMEEPTRGEGFSKKIDNHQSWRHDTGKNRGEKE